MTSSSLQTLSESLNFLATRSIHLEPCSFESLVGWGDEDMYEAFSAFVIASVMHAHSERKVLCPGRPFLEPLEKLQHHIAALFPADVLETQSWTENIHNYVSIYNPRSFFETYFTPHRIKHSSEEKGLITAYFEPEYCGNSIASKQHRMPLLSVPRLWPQGRSLPTRTEIESGALRNYSDSLIYLHPVDAYMAQVQGSARIWVQDQQKFLRLIYAGKNGHPYKSLARIVMETSTPPQLFLPAPELVAWAYAHPQEASKAMGQNSSYIFFQAVEEFKPGSENAFGPIGGAGIPLTPGRSCAVDSTLWSYGLPFWVQPLETLVGYRFPRLLFAHDTGSAICGPERLDIFFGTGHEWGDKAGRVCHAGASFVFLPRDDL